MPLYRLDERGEAIYADHEDYEAWRNTIREEDLVVARSDIIELRGHVLDVDMKQHKYHPGKTLATVVTRLKPCPSGDKGPWETWVEGKEPEYYCSSRLQAEEAHKSLVNRMIMKYGGRFIIR